MLKVNCVWLEYFIDCDEGVIMQIRRRFSCHLLLPNLLLLLLFIIIAHCEVFYKTEYF